MNVFIHICLYALYIYIYICIYIYVCIYIYIHNMVEKGVGVVGRQGVCNQGMELREGGINLHLLIGSRGSPKWCAQNRLGESVCGRR